MHTVAASKACTWYGIAYVQYFTLSVSDVSVSTFKQMQYKTMIIIPGELKIYNPLIIYLTESIDSLTSLVDGTADVDPPRSAHFSRGYSAGYLP